jgi:hypothetical protein
MRAAYKPVPDEDGTVHLLPFIRIRVGKKRGPATRHFEALVDSGAADCIFHESIAQAIGITAIESGKKSQRTGIAGLQDVWIHPVILYVGEHALNINAAFAKTLPIAGLLGRIGFFEHFKITFDPTSNPPGLELERINKA